MAILAFQQPDKVLMLESDDKVGKFEFMNPDMVLLWVMLLEEFYCLLLKGLPSLL